MYDFKDKVVVITGGSSGMGRSFVTHILARGGLVSFGDINTSLSKSLLLQVHSSAPRLVSRLLFTKTDIRDPVQVQHLFQRTKEVFGSVDLLLCVAGVNVPDSFLPSAPTGNAPNLLTIQINLSGTINTVYAALPCLKPAAKVIVISSLAGIYPSSVQPLYSASKQGLIGFARALAPLLPEGQSIHVIAPSTYLPPTMPSTIEQTADRPGTGLQMSGGMTVDASADVFTRTIAQTLGFIEMSTILSVLEDVLAAGRSGDVVEVSPDGVSVVAWPGMSEKVERMEAGLRAALVPTKSEVKVKNEDTA